MKKSASANWQGNLKDGKGHISSESGALNQQPFGFHTRFEEEPGTNPEELIGAAHAGCFAMAFSNELASRDVTPKNVDASADVHLEMKDSGPVITKSHLTVTVDIGEGNDDAYEEALAAAKAGCPIANALSCEVIVDVTRV